MCLEFRDGVGTVYFYHLRSLHIVLANAVWITWSLSGYLTSLTWPHDALLCGWTGIRRIEWLLFYNGSIQLVSWCENLLITDVLKSHLLLVWLLVYLSKSVHGVVSAGRLVLDHQWRRPTWCSGVRISRSRTEASRTSWCQRELVALHLRSQERCHN